MKNKRLLIFRIFAAAIGLFGIVYRLILHPIFPENYSFPFFQLGFFSVQSYLFITIIFIMLVINQLLGREDKWPTPPFRGSALFYGLITAILFGAFFAGSFDVRGFNRVVLFSNHVLMPLLILIDNIISVPPRSYRFDLLIYWMIYPFYYLVFTLYESYILGINRYYFLVFNQDNTSFLPYVLGLMGIMFLICAALIIFVNKIYRRSNEDLFTLTPKN